VSFLVDTNVVSELRRQGATNPKVLAWAKTVPLEVMHLSVISLFEIERGILRVSRKDKQQTALLRMWLAKIQEQFEGRILAVDDVVAMRAAALHVPDPRPEQDAFIAATALVHDLVVVTRNVKDFEPMGVRVFNPWT
jgi:predicted nucleic acid-binding protein